MVGYPAWGWKLHFNSAYHLTLHQVVYSFKWASVKFYSCYLTAK